MTSPPHLAQARLSLPCFREIDRLRRERLERPSVGAGAAANG